jgi:type I restriction enzyme M protein
LLDEKKWARDKRLYELAQRLADNLGTDVFDDHNVFVKTVDTTLAAWEVKLGAADRKALLRGLSWRDDEAPAVVKKVVKGAKAAVDPLHGRFPWEIDGRMAVVEYEPDSELSDFEHVPLLEPGGVAAFIEREVLAFAPDAWVDEKSEGRIGYEISFARHFYKPAAARPLAEIEADIRKVLAESDGLVERALDWVEA